MGSLGLRRCAAFVFAIVVAANVRQDLCFVPSRGFEGLSQVLLRPEIQNLAVVDSSWRWTGYSIQLSERQTERIIAEAIGSAFDRCFRWILVDGRPFLLRVPFGMDGERHTESGSEQNFYGNGKASPEILWPALEAALNTEYARAFRQTLRQPGGKVVHFDLIAKTWTLESGERDTPRPDPSSAGQDPPSDTATQNAGPDREGSTADATGEPGGTQEATTVYGEMAILEEQAAEAAETVSTVPIYARSGEGVEASNEGIGDTLEKSSSDGGAEGATGGLAETESVPARREPGGPTRVTLRKSDSAVNPSDIYDYLYCVAGIGMDCSGFSYYMQKSVAKAFGVDLDAVLAPALGLRPYAVPGFAGISLFDPSNDFVREVPDSIAAFRPGDIILFRGQRGIFKHSAVIQSIDRARGELHYVQCTDWAPRGERGVHASLIEFDPARPLASLDDPSVRWLQRIRPAFSGELEPSGWNDDGDRYRNMWSNYGKGVVIRLESLRVLVEAVCPDYYLERPRPPAPQGRASGIPGLEPN